MTAASPDDRDDAAVEDALRAPLDDTALVRWILTEGRDSVSTARFLNGLCWRLVDRGLPMWRVTLFAATLHPQISGFGWRWWRHRRVIEELRIPRGIEMSTDYRQSPLRATMERGESLRFVLDRDYPEHPLLNEVRAEGGTDYVSLPLNLLGARRPAIALTTDRVGGFTAAELALFETIRPAIAATVETAMVRRTARNLLSVYLGRHVGERIFDGKIVRGSFEPLRAAVMATDLRGFTGISDRMPGETVIRALDDFFEYVSGAVHDEGGHILKFVGDGALAIFGAEEGGDADAAAAGLAAARTIVARLEAHNVKHSGTDNPALHAGIGLHLGTVMYGNVGAHDRLDFTAIGPAVNLAFRLEGLTKEFLRPVLASRAFAEAAGSDLHSLGFHAIRGLVEGEEVFGLADHEIT
jgi:adenylate cyclase